jgi:hypothetical protein
MEQEAAMEKRRRFTRELKLEAFRPRSAASFFVAGFSLIWGAKQ